MNNLSDLEEKNMLCESTIKTQSEIIEMLEIRENELLIALQKTQDKLCIWCKEPCSVCEIWMNNNKLIGGK